MSKTVISVEHLSKKYDLGVIGTGTVRKDLSKWWARLRGKPDPYLTIGMTDHNNRKNGSILALDDVSFEVKQGEVLGIIGGNGAGKSTLLKILSQVTAPSSGEVKIRGRIGSLLEVGTGFHPELTGRENTYLNGSILGMSRAEVDRKFDEIVDFSGVEKFIDTPVKRYSSGMKVRLGFAVAAHLEPEILIIDEVLAVGDTEFQKKCLGKMGNVAQGGRTVLFVSHNMGSIQTLTNRSILFNHGKKLFDGDTNTSINQYYKHQRRNPTQTIKTMYKDDMIQIYSFILKEEPSVSYFTSISLLLDFFAKSSINYAYFSIEIKNSVGTKLITSWNEEALIPKGENKIQLVIPDHHLPPGEYTITLGLNYSLKRLVFNDAISFNINNEGYGHRRFEKQKDVMGTYIPLTIQINNRLYSPKYVKETS